ncbi:hypothetical protein A2U01_0053900, partial [Trifolium medium]|nr:hypothetical protein [Trifolium medium]
QDCLHHPHHSGEVLSKLSLSRSWTHVQDQRLLNGGHHQRILFQKFLDPKHRGRGNGFSMASTSMGISSICLLVGGGLTTAGEPDCTTA